MPAEQTALRSAVVDAMRGAGLEAVGVASVDAFPEVRRSLNARQQDGLHAGMAFTFRNPRRSTEPSRLLRRAESMVVGALGYLEPTSERPHQPAGRVARYAWRDYYAELRAALDVGADVLRDHGHRAMVIADANGLVDRAAAHRGGLGWWGRNANLLLPGLGSWYVLGSVVTDAALEPVADVVPDGCRTCRRCVDACPTGAIVDDGVIDARRCLAWILQQRGVMPRAYRIPLGDRLYGCDDCQDCCPPGRNTVHTAVAERHGDPEAWVPLLDLLDASDDDLLDRYGRWYIADRDARYLRRNALVVLGNIGDGRDPAVRRRVADALVHEDPLVRSHAVWAAARLGLHELLELVARDTHPVVRSELVLAPTVPPASPASESMSGTPAPVAIGGPRR